MAGVPLPVYESATLPRIVAAGAALLQDWAQAARERPWWRLEWHLDPGAWLECRGRRLDLGPRVAALVPPHTPVGRGLGRPVRVLYVHFLAGEPWDGVLGRIYAVPAAAVDGALLARLHRDLASGRARTAHDLARLRRLALALVEQVPEADLPVASTEPGVLRALAAMRSAPADPWPAIRLARLAGCPVRTFTRRCRAATGLSPHAVVLESRLQAAAALLAGGHAVEDVAGACGFSDRFHLSRRFARRFACGPAAWRDLPG